jgi:hypothetical protein
LRLIASIERLAIHHSPRKGAVHAPDLSPIELVFAKLKRRLRKAAARTSKASSPPSAKYSEPTRPTNALTTSKTPAMHNPDIIPLSCAY